MNNTQANLLSPNASPTKNNETLRNTVLSRNGNNGTIKYSRIPLNEHGNPKYSGKKKEKKKVTKTNATNTNVTQTKSKKTKPTPIFNMKELAQIYGQQMPKKLVDIINSNCLESRIIKKNCFNPLYDFPSIFNLNSSKGFNFMLTDKNNYAILINDNVTDFTEPFHLFNIDNYFLCYSGIIKLSDENEYNDIKKVISFINFKEDSKNIITKYFLSPTMCEIYSSA